MVEIILLIAALSTILSFFLFGLVKNWEWIRTTLTKWTRRGIKVIYVWVSHDEQQEIIILNLFLCGEEKSWIFPIISEKDRSSQILAIKEVHYGSSYDAYSSREDILAEWESQMVRPFSVEQYPILVKLIGRSSFRFGFNSDNDESIIVSDSFKFKTELAECKKKYRIKYVKKEPKVINRWKIKNRYPI